jgi:uncharacterized protein with von Willebrand factor type A (vWA) domain
MSRSEIEAIVGQVQRLSAEEQKVVMRRITDMLDQTESIQDSDFSYSDMFGAGRGSFATPAVADFFLRRERDSWEN